MTAREVMIEQVIATIRKVIEAGGAPAAAFSYDLGPDGIIFADCRTMPYQLMREARTGQCVITTSLENLHRMLEHETDSVSVFTRGGLRLSGDMQLVRKLDILFGTNRPVQS